MEERSCSTEGLARGTFFLKGLSDEKYYMGVGLKHQDESKTTWVIYPPGGHIFCTVVGRQNATKLRNYLNEEFLVA